MKILKGCTLSLLSFLLFLSLAIFGLAFMVNQTALNPDFVTSELNRLDISSIAEESIDIEAPSEMPNLNEVISETIPKIEPVVKEKADSAIYSVYDYLLGKSQNPELALILRNSFFNADFVSSLVDNIDISSLAGTLLSQQFAEAIPIEIENLDEYVADAIDKAEPSLKGQIVAAADPVFDYLLRKSQTLNVSISLEEVKENLRDKARQVFLESPPPELASIPRSERERYFDEFYQEYSEAIPTTFELDESIIGTDVPAKIAEGIAKAEEALTLARKYVAYFQLGYKLLIAFMVLLVIAIILIDREVKATTRRLGVPLLVYGAIEYAGIIVAKYFLSSGKLPLPEIPSSLETWMFQFIDNLMNPLETFSLGLLICGAVLTIVSFVYRRKQSSA